MAAFKSNGRGSLILKRHYPDVRPIRRASGTHDPALLTKIEAMCDALYNEDPPRHDLLDGIATGRLKPLHVYATVRQGKVGTIPSADLLPPLLETFKAWAESAESGEENRRSRLKAWKRWRESKIATAATTMGELPEVLAADRVRCAAHAVTFNNARAAAMAFVREKLSKRHLLHDQVADVPLLKATKKRRRRAFTVEGLREVVRHMGQPAGAMAWTMAVTGMGNKEYWSTPWEVYAPTHVEIHGTKRGGRDRIVPYVCPLTVPMMGEKAFRAKLKAAAPDRTIYDLRRSFSVFAANAKIDEARRSVYMGHTSAKTMTQWYEMSAEIEEYLRADSDRLRAYLGETGAQLKVMA